MRGASFTRYGVVVGEGTRASPCSSWSGGLARCRHGDWGLAQVGRPARSTRGRGEEVRGERGGGGAGGPYQLHEQVAQEEHSQGELYRATHETSGAKALVLMPSSGEEAAFALRRPASEFPPAHPNLGSHRVSTDGCRHSRWGGVVVVDGEV